MRHFAKRSTIVSAATMVSLLVGTASPALACAGLIGSNGAVNLGRTTTLAAYHDGVEHYVTAFKFLGGGGQFGTLIPLPDVPTSVERGAAVADWAHEHGFRLSPDAPEVLDFYAQRSPIFLAAVFDGDAAQQRGQRLGDGTPVHITIPIANPWVPLRILGLGKQPVDRVDADVFLLTDQTPSVLPGPRDGLSVFHSAAASSRLLDDLRSDTGMDWVPQSAWLTELRIDSSVADLHYDLAIDASGLGRPSATAAGIDAPPPNDLPDVVAALLFLIGAPALLLAGYRLA